VEFSPDGSTLFTRHEQTFALTAWDVAKARRRTDFPVDPHATALTISPDGRWLLGYPERNPRASSGILVKILDARTGAERTRVEFGYPDLKSFRFSPDGTAFHFVSADDWSKTLPPQIPWQVRTWDTATWVERPARTVLVPNSDLLLSVSPDGSTLATGSMNLGGGVTLRDTATGATLATLTPTGLSSAITALDFSPNGSTLVVGRWGGALEVWDVPSRTLRRTLSGHTPGFCIQTLRFAAEAPTLVTVAWDGRVSRLEMVSRAFRGVFGLGIDRSPGECEVAVWDLPSGRRLALMGGVKYAAISPDGSTLATQGTHETVELWDIRSRSAPTPPPTLDRKAPPR
jgi:WD40 repeat protein